VGEADKQELQLLRKRGSQLVVKQCGPCRFVPLMGKYGRQG